LRHGALLLLICTLGVIGACVGLAMHGSAAADAPSSHRSIVLGADGVGVAAVGEGRATVVSRVTAVLGLPSATPPAPCPGRAEIAWGDLTLEFFHAHLAGYRYNLGGPLGENPPPHGRVTGTPLLKTAKGATLGMTLAQVRPRYPARTFSMVQDGAIVVRGAHDGDQLFLGFFSPDRSTQLLEIKGGATCGVV